MDIIDENKYNEFKNILQGCKNINDAEYFADTYIKKNQETKKLVNCLLHGKKYSNNIKDFRTMQKIMEKCNECEYREDVMEIIKENFFLSKPTNNIQYKTLLRIADSKKILTETSYRYAFNKKEKVTPIVKNCPHPNCGRPYRGTDETSYVICGYENNNIGYDWYGCKRDWCFSCGKMLCKEWQKNQLNVDPNRLHDSECCKRHALDNKRTYITDYCQCENKYVKRSLLINL
jgi:hypothetical protein